MKSRQCWGCANWLFSNVLFGFSKPIPNLSKSSQAPAEPSKTDQRKRPGFPWILLSELSLFNGLQRPPGQKILSLLLSRRWLSWPSARFPRRTGQATTTSDFRKVKVDSVKRREEIKAVKALKTRRAAGSAFAGVILMLAGVASGASAQTSAPPPAGAEAATADNAILLTVFLKHDQSRPLSELNAQLARQGFYKAFPPPGIEVVSWYVEMGIGQVITLRLPASRLRRSTGCSRTPRGAPIGLSSIRPTIIRRSGWPSTRRRNSEPPRPD